MPVQLGKDSKGCFAKWGNQGHKYYYKCGSYIARKNAKRKAINQCIAIGDFSLKSVSDYPESVKNNAKRGIELNDKNNNKCATQVGKIRAQQLANGEPISEQTIRRMYSYLSRAETYYKNADQNDCGYISYLLWGGPEALTWSKRKVEEMDQQREMMKDIKFAESKISFDYDETLTKEKIKEKAIAFINNGINVYVISARHNADSMYELTDELGIPRSRVYATGSNKAKIEKIKELEITKHYDNNKDVINSIGSIGELVTLSIQERFTSLIKFLSNDNSAIK